MKMQRQKGNILHHDVNTDYPVLQRGEGVYVFDNAGKRYLDAVGGVGVVNIGHGVPEVITAIEKQIRTLAFSYGGMVDNQPAKDLAAELQQWAPSGMGETKTLFSSGGAEANEGAIKLAYQYHWERGCTSKRKIIGRWQSYHGNSVATLSASGRTTWRKMYDAYMLDFPHISPPYCYRCPWGKSYPSCQIDCAYELKRVIRQEGPENIAAFIAEPIIGTSVSAVVPPPEYYPMIRDICDEYDVLFIVDEVMSGVGRTGEPWGIDNWQVTPDIITTSKGVSGGYSPLGVLLISERIFKTISDGSGHVSHSCTYGGNPVSCAAGLAVLNYIKEQDLISKAATAGEKLMNKLSTTLNDLPWVGQVRGKGLFIGVELIADKESKQPFDSELQLTNCVQKEAFENGLIILGGVSGLIEGVAGDHFEILPPYVVTDDHIEFIAKTVKKSISEAVLKLPRE
jgi:adenosylmethionine-8-amino-7-oxononanoate aminotransferase